MGKNAHLHIVVETDFLNYLKDQDKKKMITLSEFCRLKLQTSLQLDRIEFMVEGIFKENEKDNRIK
jgi:hypothetical protein